jgi:hypothetical protein
MTSSLCKPVGLDPQNCTSTLTAALLDRLTHYAHILLFNGTSYGFRESQERQVASGDPLPQLAVLDAHGAHQPSEYPDPPTSRGLGEDGLKQGSRFIS